MFVDFASCWAKVTLGVRRHARSCVIVDNSPYHPLTGYHELPVRCRLLALINLTKKPTLKIATGKRSQPAVRKLEYGAWRQSCLCRRSSKGVLHDARRKS